MTSSIVGSMVRGMYYGVGFGGPIGTFGNTVLTLNDKENDKLLRIFFGAFGSIVGCGAVGVAAGALSSISACLFDPQIRESESCNSPEIMLGIFAVPGTAIAAFGVWMTCSSRAAFRLNHAREFA